MIKENVPQQEASQWRKTDTTWMLGLYGTAVGAGVLFLPITAGAGGLIPLLVMLVIAWPMTHFSHRALCRFVLSSKKEGDITDVVEEDFGSIAGAIITLLYFFAIYPILLVYSVGVTNTVDSFIVNQMHLPHPPRFILAFILVLILMMVIRFGSQFVVKAMSILVYPFVIVLMILACYLIPHWNGAIFQHLMPTSSAAGHQSVTSNLITTIWLAIPLMVFSFNHSPIISSFAVAKRKEYGEYAEPKCRRILKRSHTMMVITVMFFVFSCAFTLSPAQLHEAQSQNISVLSYLANVLNVGVISYIGPIIAFIAICKAFLGHYLGAKEGFNGLVNKGLRHYGKSVSPKKLDLITGIFMFVTAWLVATLNPNIINIIETLGGPVLAVILFLMPMYAIYRTKAMTKYRKAIASNIFTIVIGIIAITAIIYSLCIA